MQEKQVRESKEPRVKKKKIKETKNPLPILSPEEKFPGF